MIWNRAKKRRNRNRAELEPGEKTTEPEPSKSRFTEEPIRTGHKPVSLGTGVRTGIRVSSVCAPLHMTPPANKLKYRRKTLAKRGKNDGSVGTRRRARLGRVSTSMVTASVARDTAPLHKLKKAKQRSEEKSLEKRGGCNTRTSQGVTHPSTTLAQARLTSEF